MVNVQEFNNTILQYHGGETKLFVSFCLREALGCSVVQPT